MNADWDWTWLLRGPLAIGWADWWALFGHFLSLSLLSVGGALTTAPDMQRYIVGQRHWLTDTEFTASVALAQAAPGPNVLFVAVLGWNVAGLAGVAAGLIGTLLPSSVLTLNAGRLREKHRDSRSLRAFNAGLAPITVGLLLSIAWVLFAPALAARPLPSLLAAGTAMVFMLRTRRGPLWPVAAGAVAGALGWL